MSMLRHLSRPAGVSAVLLALASAGAPAGAQTFSEPSTIFYGKVLGVGSPQPFLISTGALQWVIQRADGVEVTLKTTLFPLQDGTLSYRLEVPHAAMGLGLTPAGGVPLPPLPETHLHKLVTVDGATATLLGPAGSTFTSEQLLRTATYRMDLSIGRVAPDSDGDGIADWWEDKYGLDKQNPADAGLDLNGDGITARQAYLQGLDPLHDYRKPDLLTTELVVYPAGATAILLDTRDLDSATSNLLYTLTRLPAAGTLTLRDAVPDPANPDLVLDVGARFTQADLLRGRLVYTLGNSEAQPGAFEVVLHDQDPAAACTGVVQLLTYEPALEVAANLSAAEAQRLENHLLAAAGLVVMDGSRLATNIALGALSEDVTAATLAAYLAVHGPDRAVAMIDGAGADSLRGGHRDDILFTAAGNDALAGALGADRFVFKTFGAGLKTVADFRVSELDVLDLGLLPAASGAWVHNYLRLVPTGGLYRLQVDLDGNGAGFTNLAVDLPGLAAADADLYTLIESGRLLVGGLALQPMVTVAATSPQASENGPSDGVFTLTRRGSLAGDLVVNLSLAGTAQNGVDFATVGSTATIPAGQATATVTIRPYADSATESAEIVELIVQPGSGYRVGTADRATLTIEDLLMLVEVEVLEPVAVKETLSPATFLITRRDVINRDVIVRLTLGGTAANGTDYNTLSTFVLMPANTTLAMVQVMPKATATLAGGMETVTLSIKADPAYRVSGPGSGQVAIIERIDSFADWRAREVPGDSGDLASFAGAAPAGSTITYLERYAFGVGATGTEGVGLPRPFVHEGRLGVTFRQPLGVPDVTYRVTAATDLTDWAGTQVPLVQIPAPDGSTDPQQVYYLVDPSAAAAGSVFTLVEAEWTP